MTAIELKKRFGKKLPALLREAQALRKAHLVPKMEINPFSFGKALRALREDTDISLRDMAGRIGITPPFLSDCELGRRKLSLLYTMIFLAEVQK